MKDSITKLLKEADELLFRGFVVVHVYYLEKSLS